MNDNRARYKVESVATSRRREARTIAQWERDGWELVDRKEGYFRTRLTFRRERARRWGLRAAFTVGLVLILVGAVLAATTDAPSRVAEAFQGFVADPVPPDRDADGIPDSVETAGWTTRSGQTYTTDPDEADTDGDGLTDGDEAGSPDTSDPAEAIYAGYSNPGVADTDGDELGDADEADLSLDPLNRDSDDDGIDDGPEMAVGTAPDTADTDGDGFDDGYEDSHRESQGLDPLWVDVKVSKWSYASDYAKGAVLGDLNREDSLAWLAGNLTSGGSSFIPGVGWIVGGIADVRDVIGSALHADWVGTGFSAAGAVPYAGDAVAIPGKAAKFVARNPELAASVAAAIVAISKVPEAIKVQAAKQIWNDWDALKSVGGSDKALLQLQMGRTNLDDLAAAVAKGTPSTGPAARFYEWREGETYLADLYGTSAEVATTQARATTHGCVEVCNSKVRIFDVLADGVAHESKVGYVAWSEFTRNQIREDAWLVKNGDIAEAHWHFFASARSNTIGADPRLFAYLEDHGIAYTIHVPAVT